MVLEAEGKRDAAILAPRGGSVLRPGDHVYVFCKAEDKPMLQLLFGQQERN